MGVSIAPVVATVTLPNGASVAITGPPPAGLYLPLAGGTLTGPVQTSGVSPNFRGISDANVILAATDQDIIFLSLTAGRTVQLPGASTVSNEFWVVDASGAAGANNITFLPSGSDKINGLNASYVGLKTNYGIAVVRPGGGSGGWAITEIGPNVRAAPSGAAGGELAGTYPNPTLASNALALSPVPVTLVDAATVQWNIGSARIVNAAVTLGGNRTLAINSAAVGTCGILVVTQDGTGSRTLALPAGSKVANAGGGAVTLSTAAGAVDILSFYYDGTTYWWTLVANFT